MVFLLVPIALLIIVYDLSKGDLKNALGKSALFFGPLLWFWGLFFGEQTFYDNVDAFDTSYVTNYILYSIIALVMLIVYAIYLASKDDPEQKALVKAQNDRKRHEEYERNQHYQTRFQQDQINFRKKIKEEIDFETYVNSL